MSEILSISQVAKLCSVVPSTVQFWERKGYLKSFKTLGGHRRFKKDDVLMFLQQRGRKLSHKTAEAILYTNTKKDQREEERIGLDYTVDVELINSMPDRKMVLSGKLTNVCGKGFCVLIYGLDFKKPTIKTIFDKYPNVKVWTKDQVGFLKNPLEGSILNYNIYSDYVRLGVSFHCGK